jgi:hypothetical protein
MNLNSDTNEVIYIPGDVDIWKSNLHYDEESQDLKSKKEAAYSDLLEATWKQHLEQIPS